MGGRQQRLQHGQPAVPAQAEKGRENGDVVAAAAVDGDAVVAAAAVRPGTWLGTHFDMTSCYDVAGDGGGGDATSGPLPLLQLHHRHHPAQEVRTMMLAEDPNGDDDEDDV